MIWISDSRKSRRTTVSRPSVGSSSTSSSGSGATASASDTWARWPLESRRSFARREQLEVVENLVEQSVVPARVERPREVDRFVDRHPAVERMAFGDVGDALAGLGGQRRRPRRPAASASPLSGWTMPISILIVVVLPAPLRPSRP